MSSGNVKVAMSTFNLFKSSMSWLDSRGGVEEEGDDCEVD